MPALDRRLFLSTVAALAVGRLPADAPGLPPVRAITRGPKFHWFGYYDNPECARSNPASPTRRNTRARTAFRASK